jgi:3-oxoadipate enol-lactonase
MKLKANGIQINYEFSGRLGAPVVMLSHSLGSCLSMWEPQMEILQNHYRVLRYDTRGHGGSDAPESGYTMAQLVEDAVGLLQVLSIAKVHWVGLSMGGMIGQQLALDHPDILVSLVLCDTTAIMPEASRPLMQERIELARQKGMEGLVNATLERWFTPPFLQQNPPELRRIREYFLKTPVAGYVGCSEAIQGLNLSGRLAEINIPSLIIVGEEDMGTPVAAARAIQGHIPDSRLVILPSAAHLSNVEQAKAFNQALMGFLHQVMQ